MTASNACPACGAQGRELLIDLGAVPRSGVYLSSPTSSVFVRPLSFDFCVSCGMVRQRAARDLDVDYTDVSRRTERQLPDYAEEILIRLRNEPGIEQSLVIEVGANDGTFLTRIAAMGIKRRLGIEPSRALGIMCTTAGHQVEGIHLTEGEAARVRAMHGAARAVICRHTLEHVPDPLGLVRAMRALLADDGILLVEVPASSTILGELKAFELWDEHLTYFAEANLAALLSTGGFAVEEIGNRPHLATRNIVCWARPRRSGAMEQPAAFAAESTIALCRSFGTRWRAFRDRMGDAAQSWRTPVIAVGASHPQSNFLLFSGLGADVSSLVDDDAGKAGNFVALPQPTPVITTEQLISERRVGTLLLTGFGYTSWTSKIRRGLDDAPVHFVDVLDELAREQIAR